MKPLKISLLFALLIFNLTLVKAQQGNREADLAMEYFNDGEYEKALDLFLKLHKQDPNQREYAFKIADSYLQLNKKSEAIDFAEKLAKKNKNESIYICFYGNILDKTGKLSEAENLWNDLITKKLKDQNQFADCGSFFIRNRYFEYAKKNYLQARNIFKQPMLFSNELAYVYQYMGEFQPSTTEFINFMLSVPGQDQYIQTQIFQMLREDNKTPIEKAIIISLQQNNNNISIQELLYEFYLQTENYREAIAQAKSIDKLKQERGSRMFKLAQTLQNNRNFELSNDALDYIIKNYRDSQHYLESYQEKAKNLELKAFETRPLDTLSLRKAVTNYDELFKQFGRQTNFFESMYNKAKICLFYLNDLQCAEDELNQIEKTSIPPIKKAEAKLLIGDIYLIKGDYAKALLKYVEVAEGFKESQVGAMAKFREAKMNYFKGNFESAKGYLNILKDNTSNDISNDAIKLFLLIQDNIGLDSTTTALEKFSTAQLLIYRKQYEKSLTLLDSILYAYPNHPLTDDIYWEKATIFAQQGQIDKAMQLWDKILTEHKEDVIADDALFQKAEITQYVLKDKDKAMSLYLQLLVDYPGSLYKVEARKRIREIRGDKPSGDL